MEFVLYLYHVEIVYKDREICKIVRVWLSFLPPTCSLEIQSWTRVVWCLVEWLVLIKLPFSLLRFELEIYFDFIQLVVVMCNVDHVSPSIIISFLPFFLYYIDIIIITCLISIVKLQQCTIRWGSEYMTRASVPTVEGTQNCGRCLMTEPLYQPSTF